MVLLGTIPNYHNNRAYLKKAVLHCHRVYVWMVCTFYSWIVTVKQINFT